MRRKRDVVNGDHGGSEVEEWSCIARCEKDIQMVGACRSRQAQLLPHGAAWARHQTGHEPPAIERDGETLGCVKEELVPAGRSLFGPLGDEAAQVTPDARWAAAQF